MLSVFLMLRWLRSKRDKRIVYDWTVTSDYKQMQGQLFMQKLILAEEISMMLKRRISLFNRRRNVSKHDEIYFNISCFLNGDEKQEILLPFPNWKKLYAMEKQVYLQIKKLQGKVLFGEEILHNIMAYLPVEELSQACQTCVKWNNHIANNKLLARSVRASALRTNLRFRFWMKCAKRHAIAQKMNVPDQIDYRSLVKQSEFLPSTVQYEIQNDVEKMLSRTEELDNNQIDDHEKNAAMKRILLAYTAFYGKSSYCSDMTHIVGGLLTSLDFQEDRVFHCFYILMSVYEMDMIFYDGNPGMRLKNYQLQRLLSLHHPKVAQHWQSISLTPSMFATHWFMNLFLNELSVTPEMVDHILDSFFLDGWKFIFRVIITMISTEEHLLTKLNVKKTIKVLKRVPYDYFQTQTLGNVHAIKITNQQLFDMEMVHSERQKGSRPEKC